MITPIYENRISPLQSEVRQEVEELDFKNISKIQPPLTVYACKEYNQQDYFRLVNRYRNVTQISGLQGNESLIVSATQVYSDIPEIINFCKKNRVDNVKNL